MIAERGFGEMLKRIITAFVALCVFIPILFFADTPVLPIGIAICAVLAVFEILRCTGLVRSIVISIPLYLAAAVFPFLMRYLPDGGTIIWPKIAVAAVFFIILYLFGVLIFSKGKYQLPDIATAFLCFAYSLTGLFAIQYLHDLPDGGKYVYLIVFVGAWITDIFAYFCGVLFGRKGKHKLIPEVSPKKTVEGSIGGIVFCILAMMLFGFIVQKINSSFSPNYLILAIAGLLLSVVAQIGDLALSVVKRHYGIKDYGFVFPGHGGILDRFDSVIAVSIVLAVLTSFIQLFQVI